MEKPETLFDLLEEFRAMVLARYITLLDEEYKIDYVELVDYIKKKYPLRRKDGKEK